MTVRHLDALLAPRSVAIVGASDRPGSIGATAWRNARAGTFAGPLHAVNPALRTLDGQPVFARCADLPEAPELAIVCCPPDEVAGVLGELGRLGTHAAAILTPGIGVDVQQALREAARPHLLRLLGPASLGVLMPHLGLNASLAPTDALPGELAFVAQSGALVTTVLDWARGRGVGFSHVVALGERLDVDCGDLLDWLACDWRTRAILLHVESITGARKFMSAARAAARNKPVIVVKAGRGGADADAVVDAAIRRAGMLRVDTLDDLLVAARTLTRFHGDTAHGLTLLANSRGAAVLAADMADRLGIALAPSADVAGNPAVLADDAPPARYADTLRALLARPDSGTILFMHAPSAGVAGADVARACLPALQGNAERMLSCWLGNGTATEARRLFEAAGVADHETPEQAVRAFDMLATYRRNQAQLLQCPATGEAPARDLDAARALVDAALRTGRAALDGADALALLAAYGVPTATAATLSPSTAPLELELGAGVDPTFGPTIHVGQGGAAAATAADRAVALAPLNRVLARDTIARTRVGQRLLHGPAPALAAVEDVLVALAQVMADLPAVVALAVAPLEVGDDGARARAARVELRPAASAGTDRFAILPYPSQLEESVPWEDGTVLLRPIRPEDLALHREFLAQASAADLRMRFFSSRREVPPTELARLVQIDYAREMAFVAVAHAGTPAARTLGVVRAVSDPDNVEAEFAIITRSDLHGHGIGSMLMRKLAAYLRANGTARIVGQVLNDNSPMHAFMREQGFAVEAACREPGVTAYRLEIGPAPPAPADQRA